jgi:hypothetical protein
MHCSQRCNTKEARFSESHEILCHFKGAIDVGPSRHTTAMDCIIPRIYKRRPCIRGNTQPSLLSLCGQGTESKLVQSTEPQRDREAGFSRRTCIYQSSTMI